ncbi:MAG: hypothetical protein GC137_06220 [Alphaproteobacteria bacterium]|nr:hypothetical protein [Alphaproteobacteria bacterium]
MAKTKKIPSFENILHKAHEAGLSAYLDACSPHYGQSGANPEIISEAKNLVFGSQRNGILYQFRVVGSMQDAVQLLRDFRRVHKADSRGSQIALTYIETSTFELACRLEDPIAGDEELFGPT